MTDAQRAFDDRQKLAKKRQRERSTKRKRVDPAFIEKVTPSLEKRWLVSENRLGSCSDLPVLTSWSPSTFRMETSWW